MTQKRYIDAGVLADDRLFKELFSGLTGPTVLAGGELGVYSTDQLVLSPVWFSARVPSVELNVPTQQYVNVVVQEDQPQVLEVPITSSAKTYTITYRGTFTPGLWNGTPLTLEIEEGQFDNSQVDGVVLGWVKYPGLGVPLSQGMLIPAPRMRIEALANPADMRMFRGSDLLPTLAATTADTPNLFTTSGTVSRTVVWDSDWGEALQVSGTTPSAVQMRLALSAERDRPGSVCVDYVVATGFDVPASGFEIYDTNGDGGAAYLEDDYDDVTLRTISGNVLRRRRLRIINGTFEPGKRFFCKASLSITGAGNFIVTGFGVGPYGLPFAS